MVRKPIILYKHIDTMKKHISLLRARRDSLTEQIIICEEHLAMNQKERNNQVYGGCDFGKINEARICNRLKNKKLESKLNLIKNV
jgi:hypothetical protein